MNDQSSEIGAGERPLDRPRLWAGSVRRSLRVAVDLLLPPRCLSCGTLVDHQGALCVSCWSGMSFVSDPQCACCGLPFDHNPGHDPGHNPGHDRDGEMLCGACLREPPPYDRARAVLRYDDASRRLVLGFKHADRTEAAATFAAWMARAAPQLVADSAVIAPVPLHWRRLFGRRYNQSALLSQALAAQNERPGLPDLLVRHRATPSQGRLSAAQRRRNVAGAFAVRAGHEEVLRGRRLLLVDDVMTTGATVAACARAALAAGAEAVDVVVLARAVRD
ncbi:MAG TPA: ComF family protein [Kiloniellaceae bacterium]|nr:ComF family protein [Kiloniellaceae bacterium]